MDTKPETPCLRIFVDADACPVKDETYRVAARYKLKVYVVANSPILVPRAPGLERVAVGAGPDVADDWIVEHSGEARSSSPPTFRSRAAASRRGRRFWPPRANRSAKAR
jgi:hypothetical protein